MKLEISQMLILAQYAGIMEEIAWERWNVSSLEERKEILSCLFADFEDISDVMKLKKGIEMSFGLEEWIDKAVEGGFDKLPEPLWPFIIMAYDYRREEFNPPLLRARISGTYAIVS